MREHLKVAELMASNQIGLLVQDPKGISRVFEANHDLHQMCSIVEVLLAETPPKTLLRKLREFLGGQPLPQDATACAARNLQFELEVGSRFKLAGLRVEWSEPDVVVHFAKRRIAVAAKRISSQTQLQKRVKEAARQIERAQMLGFIAIEISTAANRDNHPIIVQAQTEAMKRVPEFYDEFSRIQVEQLRGKVDSPLVLGAWFDLRVHMYTEDGGFGTDRSSLVHTFNEPYPGCQRVFLDLTEAVASSMLGPPPSGSPARLDAARAR